MEGDQNPLSQEENPTLGGRGRVETEEGPPPPPKNEPKHAPAQETLFQVQKSGGVRLGNPPPS